MPKFKCYVGVPVYNEEKYIEQTLLSLIRQDEDNVCFHVSDNCSTDNTWNIINDICARDKRFFLTRQEKNVGAFENFKQLYDVSDSQYFMWLGGHDYISDGYLSAMKGTLDHDESLSMAFGIPHKILDGIDQGRMEKAIHTFSKRRIARFLQATKNITLCAMCQALFRRELLKNFDFRMRLGADFVMICHLLWYGNIKFVEGCKYYARFFSETPETSDERVTGQKNKYLSNYDFIIYQLDSLANLYRGDPRIKQYLEYEIIHALQQYRGIHSLMINDDR